MTLKEDIMNLANARKSSDVELFLSAYAKDSLVFGEDTAAIYADVYQSLMGEDFSELFEAVDEKFNTAVLCEAGGMPDDVAKAISAYRENHPPTLSPTLGYGGIPGNVVKAINNYSASQAAKGGFFSKIGTFFKSIKDGFMGSKVFEGLKQGLTWMVGPGLPTMVGSAAGIGVIAAIITALKKRGKNKEAEKLNAALEAAKAKAKK